MKAATAAPRPEKREFMTAVEAAAYLKIPRSTFSRMAHGKVPGLDRLPGLQVGRKKLIFDRFTIDLWFAKQER